MKIYSKIKYYLSFVGFNPTVLITFFRSYPLFLRDLIEIRKQIKKSNNKDFNQINFFPQLGCRFNKSGNLKGHYVHQDLLIAKKIFKNNPVKHIDIGSRQDGFITHLAVFRDVEVFDIRPQESKIKEIKFTQLDLLQLPENLVEYCDSISSLHAIEHFGLGRYGDPVDIDGHLKGLNNIYKMLKKDGKFYFAVPIGPQRIEFNAHKVFNVSYLLGIFDGLYKIDSFSYVDDNGDLFENVPLILEKINCNYGCNYGLGIFEMTKI
jgi:hypothetical protein